MVQVHSAAAMEQQQVGDERALVVVRAPGTGAAVAGGGREPEGLPCPRCDSANTKFCYYNNYNLAQPRHFCRDCRRYWTRGGALRNVPVGGGTRNKLALPSASSSSSSSSSSSRRKRPASSASAPPTTSASPPPTSALMAAPPPMFHGGSLLRPYGGMAFAAPTPLAVMDPADRRLLDFGGGSFTSLIAPGGAADVGLHFSAGFLVGGRGLAHAAAALPLPRAPASAAAAASALLPPPPPPPSHQQQEQQTTAATATVSQALPPEGVFWSSMGWPDLSI